MALSPFIRTSTLTVRTVLEPDANLLASGFLVRTLINFPSQSLQSTGLRVRTVLEFTVRTIVSGLRVRAVVRGRIGSPRLRAWTFTLDGHDFYVLRLGDTLTLVYDVYSEQWMDWSDFEKVFWRPNIGINWTGGDGLAPTYGSNVVAGDDTFGLLWFLDPEQPYDEHPEPLNSTQQLFFERITMGQVPVRGREVVPCYATWLTADSGDPAYTGAGVQMLISDDGGKSFQDVGTVTVTLGDAPSQINWYSLGQITAPGRLFKIVDDGAITRIDSLEMNDDGR
jgi:hypothetical protein